MEKAKTKMASKTSKDKCFFKVDGKTTQGLSWGILETFQFGNFHGNKWELMGINCIFLILLSMESLAGEFFKHSNLEIIGNYGNLDVVLGLNVTLGFENL